MNDKGMELVEVVWGIGFYFWVYIGVIWEGN